MQVCSPGTTWNPRKIATVPTGSGESRTRSPDRVISTVDPVARHAHKTQSRRHGVSKAYGGRTGHRVDRRPRVDQSRRVRHLRCHSRGKPARRWPHNPCHARGACNPAVVIEVAYATGSMLQAAQDKRWAPPVKGLPLVRRRSRGAYILDDFTQEPHAMTLTCPDGNTVRSARSTPPNSAKRAVAAATSGLAGSPSRCGLARGSSQPRLRWLRGLICGLALAWTSVVRTEASPKMTCT